MAALTTQPSYKTYRPAGLENAAAFREVVIAHSADSKDLATSITISSGAVAPTHTRNDGSLYVDRATGNWYRRVSGAWVEGEGGVEIATDAGGAG